MSLRRLSPTANLLRTSRLFSLPPPLPRPAPDVSAISNYDSDTATTPYPTHAAIETTQSSLARGDWGLKRALPLKSTTKTSTPVIHINNIDSIDHITDFDSAADHTITLRKWQQIDMPLSIPEQRKNISGYANPKSVFDSQYDNTEVSEKSSPISSPKERWKYKGPWLAGKTDGEFNDYVEKKVKRRKTDFRRYVRESLAHIKTASLRREAIENGEDLENLASDEVRVSEEEIDVHMRRLRDKEEDLHKLVEKYLDLPREEGQSVEGTQSQYDVKGPPTTHPSAGLSYLRTASHIYNHPEFGPQENQAPVQGRVIQPQKTRDRINSEALIGVAGVVGKDQRRTFFKEKTEDNVQGINHFDPDIPGGGKVWTKPTRASIDPNGRIELQLDRAEKNALNVANGIYADIPKLPPAAVAGAEDSDVPDLAPAPSRNMGKTLGYGLEDMEGAKSSERVTPFLGPDDEAPNEALNELIRHGSLGPRR